MTSSGLPIAEVDIDRNITILKHIKFQCTGCADCCKLNYIPVTEKDIDRFLDNGVEVDQAIESLSPILIPSSNVEGGFIKSYILKKKPFIKECAFLDENNLCKIHSFKPLACQLYPFAVRKSENGFIAIIHPDSVCNYIYIDVDNKDSNTLEVVKKLITLLSLE